jgi:nicotinate-nucleotide pyrophosphorylase (carboxylating)
MEYPRITELPEDYVKAKIAEFLAEDAPKGDFTTLGTIGGGAEAEAVIQAEEDLVFAGAEIIGYFFDESFKTEIFADDGDTVGKGVTIAKITGPAGIILTRERVLLNLLQRLCGIASLTRKYVEIAMPYNVRILDTRKTTPGLRLFEKYAVTVGGGYNHRLDLSSGVLIKDNHLKASRGVRQAVEGIKRLQTGLPIELEVEGLEQIKEGMESGVDGFLLDNMAPETARKAVNLIRGYAGGKDKFIEVSGGVNLNNLEGYLKTGIDAISVGALTHSVKSSVIHLEFIS